MGKNSLRGTTTCYVINSRADERFLPKYARHGKQTAGTPKKDAFLPIQDHVAAFRNMVPRNIDYKDKGGQ